MGNSAAVLAQGLNSVAIGLWAAENTQGVNSVAIGAASGRYSQGDSAVALGVGAGQTQQASSAIAIGALAGSATQKQFAIAIGSGAGQTNQGTNSIAIGQLAGQTNQHANSIVINALGTALNTATANAFYVAPIRETSADGQRLLMYNTTTDELTYSSANSKSNKTFVIENPTDPSKYLVHACIEGPEAGVYYRGKGEITNDRFTIIHLPTYADKIAHDFTIQITPIYSGPHFSQGIENIPTPKTISLYPSEIQNNSFAVYGVNAKFHWIVTGKRHDIEVEPDKRNVNLRGDGPYTWLDR
jgi:hypothetical protein